MIGSACAKECDHGSPCVLSRGHIPPDRHETEHGCIFYDLSDYDRGRRAGLGEAARLYTEVHRLQCAGAFSLERDPFALMPAIDAYAAGEISGGKMRECIRRWLAGANFGDTAQREWEVRRG